MDGMGYLEDHPSKWFITTVHNHGLNGLNGLNGFQTGMILRAAQGTSAYSARLSATPLRLFHNSNGVHTPGPVQSTDI